MATDHDPIAIAVLRVVGRGEPLDQYNGGTVWEPQVASGQLVRLWPVAAYWRAGFWLVYPERRRASPKLVWPPKVPTLPSPLPHHTSFMWAWKIRSPKRSMKPT